MHADDDDPQPPSDVAAGADGDSGAETLLAALREIVGAAHALDADAASERASHFWNPAPLSAFALVRPASTSELAAVLALCHRERRSVVTHGGLTGLVGGERSGAEDVIVSLERFDAIEALDPVGRTVTCGAGCRLERVQIAAREAGLELGLDLGARGSCTIGGNLSTNAGGLSVLRHGMAREQVLGLEAVLADGTVLSSLNRMMKNNTGYDLKQLFIGSEGTLGIITRAVLRLRAATPIVRTALLACERFEQVAGLLAHTDRALDGTLHAFEVMWRPFFALNTDPDEAGASVAPLGRDHPFYVILESRGSRDTDAFETLLGEALERDLIVDAVLAQSERERGDLWRIRENIDIVLRREPLYVYDVSLPIVAMADYVETLGRALRARWPDAALFAYGHLADGNLHLSVAPRGLSTVRADGAMAMAGVRTPTAEFTIESGVDSGADSGAEPAEHLADPPGWHADSDEIVYGPLRALGGSVSAEHGIGLDKKAHLSRSRTPEEIALMRTLKRTLDPHAILNPGKVV